MTAPGEGGRPVRERLRQLKPYILIKRPAFKKSRLIHTDMISLIFFSVTASISLIF